MMKLMDSKTEERLRRKMWIKPTPGELLVIHRRRCGMSQRELAALFEVGIDKYRAWESDAGDVPPPPKRVMSDKLKLEELIYLRRRRLGVSLAELGYFLGRSISATRDSTRGGTDVELVVNYLLEKERRSLLS